jgi:hypothetical protein
MSSNRPVYNYDVESAAIGNCSLMALIPADRLPGLLERHPELSNCHHYAICRRPRISVQPISLHSDVLALQFSADHGDGDPAVLEVDIPTQIPSGAQFDNSAFPASVRILGESNDVLFEERAAGLLTGIMSNTDRDTRLQCDLDFLDLTVVYIGQALGPGERRSAVDRLVSHSTLQKILADTLTHMPHLDVWIVLMAFDGFSALSAFGLWEGSLGSARSEEHLENLLTNPLRGGQLANLVEGALIAYFNRLITGTSNIPFRCPDTFHMAMYTHSITTPQDSN